VQITRTGAYAPIASPDGKWLYYAKGGGALWKVLVDGGEETEVLPGGSLTGNVLNFASSRLGIYFLGPKADGGTGFPLMIYRFEDGKTAKVGTLEQYPTLQFSISPDEKWMLYTRLDSATDDLMLVENFH